jgi:hypothetical protein
MSVKYTLRLVAFIDILGSKELLTGETAAAYAAALFTILTYFLSKKTEIWFELPHI